MIPYAEYRTGLTFADVRLMLKVEADSKLHGIGERMFITRRTVLGRWRQLKMASYDAYRRAHAGPQAALIPERTR